MISIYFEQDEKGNYSSFHALGHAEYALREGEPDIVCAGITALLSGLITSLSDLLEIKIEYHLEEGDLFCRVLESQEEQRKEINLLFASYEKSCEQISYSYGKKFVQIKKKITRRLT